MDQLPASVQPPTKRPRLSEDGENIVNYFPPVKPGATSTGTQIVISSPRPMPVPGPVAAAVPPPRPAPTENEVYARMTTITPIRRNDKAIRDLDPNALAVGTYARPPAETRFFQLLADPFVVRMDVVVTGEIRDFLECKRLIVDGSEREDSDAKLDDGEDDEEDEEDESPSERKKAKRESEKLRLKKEADELLEGLTAEEIALAKSSAHLPEDTPHMTRQSRSGSRRHRHEGFDPVADVRTLPTLRGGEVWHVAFAPPTEAVKNAILAHIRWADEAKRWNKNSSIPLLALILTLLGIKDPAFDAITATQPNLARLAEAMGKDNRVAWFFSQPAKLSRFANAHFFFTPIDCFEEKDEVEPPPPESGKMEDDDDDDDDEEDPASGSDSSASSSDS